MTATESGDGLLTPFIFTDLAVRGAIVQVGEAWRDWSSHRNYPATVQALLGQAMAAVPLMASTLKFEGRLSMQAEGDGAVPLLVAQATHDLQIRGMSRWLGEIGGAPNPSLFGKGRLGLIIENLNDGQRYDALVPLEGETLAACLIGYFAQSEQLETHLILADHEEGFAGLLIQRMPGERTEDEDAWHRLKALCETLNNDELLGLAAVEVLRRLFHEESVEVFPGRNVILRCRCSHGRTSELLLNLGEDEVRAILAEQGHVEMECSFCGQKYVYESAEVDQLFAAGQAEPPTRSRH